MRRACALALVALACLPGAARARSKSPGEILPSQGLTRFDALVGMPFHSQDGVGWLTQFSGTVWLESYEALGLRMGLAGDPDGHTVPGNLVLSNWIGIDHEDPKKGYYIAGGLGLDLGFGIADLDDGGGRAASWSTVAMMSWPDFLAEHLAIAPRLDFALVTHAFQLGIRLGPALAVPIFDPQPYDYLGALDYDLAIIYGARTRRAEIGFNLGLEGLAEWTRDQAHLLSVKALVYLEFYRLDLSPLLLVRVPVHGPDAGVDLSVILGLSWDFQAWGEERRL
ncbi:MAG: hypothetical protein JXR96_03600 [Deltaproteobacteria bacterium]|nr:hypothetical protein [Deltaproteobacteria bacterium]